MQAGSIALAVAQTGPIDGVPLVLIQGLGQTLRDWPEAFLARLGRAGFRVTAFDNRDCGRSARLDALGSPPLLRMWLTDLTGLRLGARPPYPLSEMASDLRRLLDALKLERAHLVGVSMGGMIAQRLAITSPGRVASLTCIMSSSGAPGLSRPRRDIRPMLWSSPARNLSDAIDRAVIFRQALAGPRTETDRAELAGRAQSATRYGWPAGEGVARQFAAVLSDRARWSSLGRITCPTLVLHGERDPLLPPDHGLDLARRIPGARHVAVPTMGHEILHSLSAPLAEAIADHVAATGTQHLNTLMERHG